MELFAKKNMPLRGAIGIGDYISDDEINIFLSNIFKALNNAEKSQEWSGCVLLKAAEDEIICNVMGNKPVSPKQSDVLHQLSVPSNTKAQKKQWCLNWSYKLTDDEIKFLLDYMSGNAIKQKHTQKYLEHLKSLPDDSQQLPDEFYPAVKLKALKTRQSINVQFENEHGVPVKPGCEWGLSIIEQE